MGQITNNEFLLSCAYLVVGLEKSFRRKPEHGELSRSFRHKLDWETLSQDPQQQVLPNLLARLTGLIFAAP